MEQKGGHMIKAWCKYTHVGTCLAPLCFTQVIREHFPSYRLSLCPAIYHSSCLAPPSISVTVATSGVLLAPS